jgi:hypothetical protein
MEVGKLALKISQMGCADLRQSPDYLLVTSVWCDMLNNYHAVMRIELTAGF